MQGVGQRPLIQVNSFGVALVRSSVRFRNIWPNMRGRSTLLGNTQTSSSMAGSSQPWSRPSGFFWIFGLDNTRKSLEPVSQCVCERESELEVRVRISYFSGEEGVRQTEHETFLIWDLLSTDCPHFSISA